MKFYFSLLLSITSFISYAQNYSGQYPGAMHFYSVNGSNVITTIREDTNYVNGFELTRIPELLMRGVGNENILDTNCMFWGGPQCQYKKDGATLLGSKIISGNNFVKYFNFFGDSLNVRFDISIGSTQTVYKDLDTNLLVKYSCVSKDTATVFGVSDSIIVFTVITTDSLSNLITSDLSGDTIIYSKNAGLLKGFSFNIFPYVETEYPYTILYLELEGIRNPNYGFYGFTEADAFNFQPGDTYETTFGSPTVLYRDFYEILSRTDNLNSVTYSLKNIKGTANPPYPPAMYYYDTSIINNTYSKVDFVDELHYNMDGYLKNTSVLSGCYTSYKYNYYYSDYCYEVYCPSANCYGDTDCFGAISFSGTYMLNLGIVNKGTSENGMGSYSIFNLSYFNKNNLECGSSYILSSDEINFNTNLSIFPNPSNHFITIQTDQNFPNAKIHITDLSGREVELHPFNQSILLDISRLSSGIYFVKMSSEDKTVSVQKFIKQ